ncbi:XRE family transcriptional regulator [Streptomyces paludis]|uniref:XRE family transcriptional regulator n=1 Tax=Streptomyces paludis TaxID=2282738 RepID=A0A345I0N5_9ACTN|nr:helix-turn-helix transcriptional regulator [Streptomyces paludis]AXG82509.1 XRE family transcriptional regulator [Streptomyces paludis]
MDNGGTGTDSGAAEGADGTDEPDWEPGSDEESDGVITALGRQIKLWRMAAGLSQIEFGVAIGYSENQVYKVEAGKRIPRPEFLDKADKVLKAGGRISAMKADVAVVRYPRKVRNLAKLEAEAVELGAYGNTVVHGLLQTEAYARSLYGLRRPAYDDNELERLVAARLGRQSIFDRRPFPLLTFVQEEAVLRRPVGGRMVLRGQLEHLLKIGKLRHVEIQVMPTSAEEHSGLGGSLQVLKLQNGATVGHNEVQLISRVISDPKEVQILDMRYGMIRSQALRPRESMAFIEKLLGET